MAELAILADIQWTVYPEEVTCQLHVMVQQQASNIVGRKWNQQPKIKLDGGDWSMS